MSQLKIGLRDNQTRFEPGQEIAGAAGWELAVPPRSVEVRLLWFTRGQAIEDIGVVHSALLDDPKAAEARSFTFQLPEMPHSFAGRLASLTWAVELVVLPSKEHARAEFVMAPGGEALRL
jgi:hypothetical protein